MKHNQKGFISLWIVVLGAIVAIVLLATVPTVIKMHRLQSAADERADALNSIQIVNGQSTDAEGLVDGDLLTANDDEKRSSYAQAVVDTGGNLMKSFSFADSSLTDAGFILDGGPESPYYQLSNGYGAANDITTSSIVFRYLNEDEQSGVVIRFVFDRTIDCPAEMVCKYAEGSEHSEDIFDYEKLFDENVRIVHAKYTHITNDYHIRRGF